MFFYFPLWETASDDSVCWSEQVIQTDSWINLDSFDNLFDQVFEQNLLKSDSLANGTSIMPQKKEIPRLE